MPLSALSPSPCALILTAVPKLCFPSGRIIPHHPQPSPATRHECCYILSWECGLLYPLLLSPTVVIANFKALLELWPWQAGSLQFTMDAAYLQCMVQPAPETDPETPFPAPAPAQVRVPFLCLPTPWPHNLPLPFPSSLLLNDGDDNKRYY